MKRRHLILGGLGLGAAGYMGMIVAGLARPCGTGRPRLAALTGPRRIAKALLRQGYVGRGKPPAPDPDTLATAAQRDFAAGDTVLCDGWVLARSEADFALACLRDETA
ncbi:hypothetical protein [Rhodovulum sp. MB263]|uniref:hypothetical protein n=1 Tax=Rhodovulum sp. (strain MB263) TaxID=308754 RepID=UPI0009B78582|nr:hypothetical protein [Rhodovulum sp. MB263]ARC88325.1 hypothetical protein B5V46_06730 [Rhodovulum sp. MB263]